MEGEGISSSNVGDFAVYRNEWKDYNYKIIFNFLDLGLTHRVLYHRRSGLFLNNQRIFLSLYKWLECIQCVWGNIKPF